jgi:hypothetical protein
MPQSWAGFRDKNNTEAMEIQRRDPELVALLSGTAGAALRADALSGALSPSAPSIADREKEDLIKQASELFNQGEKLNLTGQMLLARLNPDAHKRWQAQFETSQNGDVNALDYQTRKGQIDRARMASKNGYSGQVS